jgi:hypothetical protein
MELTMANENYLISVNDRRFNKTWIDWTDRILWHLDSTPSLYGADYVSTLDFNVYEPNQAPDKEIPRRIYQALTKMRSTPLEVVYIGYDADYAESITLSTILTQFMARRKRFDYEVHATSAYALTHSLNTEFLDYPIPRLNIIAVTYLGSKEFIS